VSLASLASRTARLHVVPPLPLVLCVVCSCGVVRCSVACCACAAAGLLLVLCVAVSRAAYAVRPARRMWAPTLPTNLPGDGLTSACLALRSICFRACSSGLTELEPPRPPLSSLRSPLLFIAALWPPCLATCLESRSSTKLQSGIE
jgi:hypothetical protein